MELTAGRGKDKRAIPLNGNEFNMVPAEHFPAFAQSFRSHVEAGSFDNELRTANEDGITANDRTAAPRKPRGPLSPEKLAQRNAKREATMAARKAR